MKKMTYAEAMARLEEIMGKVQGGRIDIDELAGLLKEAQEQTVPMVQISTEEWMRLTETLHRMEALSADLTAQKADLKTSAESYVTVMKKAAEAQKEATVKALDKITREATEQVGKASARASEVIDRRIRRDEAIWFLRLAITFIPPILILLLWVYVGLRM